MNHSSLLERIALVAVCGVASAACMENPNNGTTVSGATGTTSLSANGLHSVGSMTIALQSQKNMGGDPNDDTNWQTVQTTTTSSTGVNLNDPSHLAYSWSTSFVPGSGVAWTQGGLQRVRALANPNSSGPIKLTTFDQDDESSCIGAEIGAGKSWITAGNDCASPFPLPPILVSTYPTPADQAVKPAYLTFTGQNTDVPSYYAAIHAPSTLATFKSSYGFGAAGSDEAHAIYYNNGDLGLARDMHCKSFTNRAGSLILGGGVACYVTNYAKRVGGQPDFGNDPTTGLNDAIAGNNPVATVAMVSRWSILSTTLDNPITFMVFDGEGNLTNQAPLDRVHANTSIPNNCITCHGGSASYDSVAHKVTGATFLPFDPASFLWATNPGYTQADQADAVRRLNAHVMSTSPAAGVKDLVTGMYGGKAPSDPTATFTDAYVPSGWSGSKASTKVYQQVMKPYCRTCHIAQDPSGGIPFAAYSDFTGLKAVIADFACSSHLMPHAEQTARRFWASPARAYLVNALGINSACAP